MYIVDIADELFRELGEPTDISIPSISFWLRTNINKLNNLINTSYILNNNLEIVNQEGETIDSDAVAIFKCLFTIEYYNRQIRKNLGAAANDAIIQVSSDGATVRSIDKNNISQTYLDLRKTESEQLQNLLNGYRRKKYTPQHVVGDDVISASN